ncbi:hypothetical protein HF086_007341 [Spodoptera exigua]|uniref:Uncharacterized protein n=1 Tax=Spodoptera exigua TaxID=7107 RepID=A0A922MKD5_SPOEX|nr:hypothetical protein HF086_007341 [Spodoptera exigua]
MLRQLRSFRRPRYGGSSPRRRSGRPIRTFATSVT